MSAMLFSPFEQLLHSAGLIELMHDSHKFDKIGSGLLREQDLRSYQRYLADKIVELPAVLGAADMGLGKSAATLTAIRRLLRAGEIEHVLIVAPLQVATRTWPDEIERWKHLRHLTFAVATGDEAERSVAIAADVELTMINRENLQWLWQKVGGLKGWKWDALVYDESSRLKAWRNRTPGKKADGTKTKKNLTEFGVLAQARSKFKRIVELSGTPAPNGLVDLGGQAFILDGGVRLGPSRTAFLERWFDVNPWSHKIIPKDHARAQIMERMSDVMIGLRAQDYIDLPPQVFNPIYVRLPAKLMKRYRDFERTLYSEEYDVEAVNQGVLTGKLLQLANGSLYRDVEEAEPPRREVIRVHDLKLKALESIVEEAAGQPVLIAYSFRFDRDVIRKRFPNAVLFDEDPQFVKKWNAGKIEIGLAHPASIGHGLNLQFGGHIQVWYGLTWSLELWDQFNRRLARPGQESPSVFIHVIMARGTEDERQYADLQTKGITQDEITEHVRVKLI
jgi:SNF2 family DNA or RNA helicase